MKIKIFFSYSTKDKAFLDNMLQSFGHDFAIVDHYALESGKELWPEIRKLKFPTLVYRAFLSP